MQFKDIIGHQNVKKRLINSVKEGRISHAQLFLGSEGCGNLPLAIAYAQYISCLEITLYKKGDGHISFGTSYTISAEGREPVICSDLIILDCVITDRINTNILDYLYLRRVIESNSSGPLINGCKNIYSNLERKLKISLYLNND